MYVLNCFYYNRNRESEKQIMGCMELDLVLGARSNSRSSSAKVNFKGHGKNF